MSTDTDWLREYFEQNFLDGDSVYTEAVGTMLSAPHVFETLAPVIAEHESQAVKAADKAGRIEELDDLSVVAQYWHQEGLATEPYEMIAGRIQQLQGDSTGATPPIIDHRTDMEL